MFYNVIPAPEFDSLNNHSLVFKSIPIQRKCKGHIILDEILQNQDIKYTNKETSENSRTQRDNAENSNQINSKSIKAHQSHPKMVKMIY